MSSKELIQAFVGILGGVQDDQVITIGSSCGELIGTGEEYSNLSVETALLRDFRYVGDDEITHGLDIIGMDCSPDGVRHRLFVGFPTMLKISNIHNDETLNLGQALFGFGEAFSNVINEGIKQAEIENMGDDELAAYKAAEEERLETTVEGFFDKPFYGDVIPGEKHKGIVLSTLANAIAKIPGFISPDDQVVALAYQCDDKDHTYFDMLVTEIIEVPEGVVVGFYDVDPINKTRKKKLLDAVQGETVSIEKLDKYYFLLRNITETLISPVEKYAVSKFVDKDSIDMTIPPQVLQEQTVAEDSVFNIELLNGFIGVNKKYITGQDCVVSLVYDGETEKDMYIIDVTEVGKTSIVSYVDLRDFESKIHRKRALIEFLINGIVEVPHLVRKICVNSLDKIEIQDSYDYAAYALAGIKESGTKDYTTVFENEPELTDMRELFKLRLSLKDDKFINSNSSIYVVKLQNETLHGIVITDLEAYGEEGNTEMIYHYRELKYEGVDDQDKIAMMLAKGETVPLPGGITKQFVAGSVRQVIQRTAKEYGVAKLLREETEEKKSNHQA